MLQCGCTEWAAAQSTVSPVSDTKHSFLQRSAVLRETTQTELKIRTISFWQHRSIKACHKNAKNGSESLYTSESHYEWTHKVREGCQHVLYHSDDQKTPVQLKIWLFFPTTTNSSSAFFAALNTDF